MSDDKVMKLRYAGTCRLCGIDLPAKEESIYERSTETVRCVECSVDATLTDAAVIVEPVAVNAAEEVGVAGSSARREYERCKLKDEERLRQRWGKLGGILRPKVEKVLVGQAG